MFTVTYISKLNISFGKKEVLNEGITRCSERRELVEEFGVLLLAAHSGHCADIERQVPERLASK